MIALAGKLLAGSLKSIPVPILVLIAAFAAVSCLSAYQYGLLSASRAETQREAKAHTKASLALTAKTAELTTCSGDLIKIKGTLSVQSEAVKAYERESEARLAASRKATQAARSVVESYRRTERELASMPDPGGDSCAAADALMLAVKQ
jgi:hypothetical protein